VKKVLFVATVDSHIELFHLPYLKMFKEHGYEVHVATNTDKVIRYCDKKHKISIERNPLKLGNLKAIKQLKKVIDDEGFSIIHCHTPMGSVVARMAAKKARKKGTRIIYTAHGFHFYKGASLKNWMLFYPVEKYLAKYTDTLITINGEDYELAKKKFNKRCMDIRYVPGVGVDEKKFAEKPSKEERHRIRESLSLKDDDYVMIFPAELSKRKNQMWLIKNLLPLFKNNNKIHLLLPGKDSLNGRCQRLSRKLGLEKQVHFLGFRNDINILLKISDIAISSSKQEGLPVNLLEAAYAGLPIAATDCRGNRDIVECSNNAKDFLAVICSGGAAPRDTETFRYACVKERYEDIYFSHSERISIVIPVYNAEKYVGECIESIIKQGFNDRIEIIIINDGSSDCSKKICEEYSKRYDFVNVYSQKNSGVSSARNAGLAKATGSYVFFMDADDLLLEGSLEMIVRALATCPDIVSWRYKRFYGNKINSAKRVRIINVNKKDEILSRIQGLSLSQNLFKMSIITDNHLRLNESLHYTEDMDMALEVIAKARTMAIIDSELYGYRHNSSSATSSITRVRIENQKTFIEKWKSAGDKRLRDFVAYQFLITCGMIGNAPAAEQDKSFISDNINLLAKPASLKTKIGWGIYRLFGEQKLIKAMSEFLRRAKGAKYVE